MVVMDLTRTGVVVSSAGGDDSGMHWFCNSTLVYSDVSISDPGGLFFGKASLQRQPLR
jgi:hypothetical protein